MKHLFFGAFALALWPMTSFAQPQSQTPSDIDPAAKAVLDGMTAKYHAAKGVRLSLAVTENKNESHYNVSFQKPNLMRVEMQNPLEKSTVISDGKATYSIRGTSYESGPLANNTTLMWQAQLHSGTGIVMPTMLEGRSLSATLERIFKMGVPAGSRFAMAVLEPTIVDGDTLHGVKITVAAPTPAIKTTPSSSVQVYFWLDSDGLLRRISTQGRDGGRSYTETEKISDQQLDPTFAPDTFKFSAAGLKPASDDKAAAQDQFFDPRLKVGAVPFAFTAKDLKGRTISPANYKGKVLILDFWATWCGPCVASLPELKATYDKYHAKGLEVVSISLDEDKKALTTFMAQKKMMWPQIYDGKGWKARVPGIYGVRAIPFMLVVGKNGKIAAVEPEGNLEGAVKAALAAK